MASSWVVPVVVLLAGALVAAPATVLAVRYYDYQLWKRLSPRKRAEAGLVPRDDPVPAPDIEVDVPYYIERKQHDWLSRIALKYYDGNLRKALRELLDFCVERNVRIPVSSPQPRHSPPSNGDETPADTLSQCQKLDRGDGEAHPPDDDDEIDLLDIDDAGKVLPQPDLLLFDARVRVRHQMYLHELMTQAPTKCYTTCVAMRAVLFFAMNDLGTEAIFDRFPETPTCVTRAQENFCPEQLKPRPSRILLS